MSLDRRRIAAHRDFVRFAKIMSTLDETDRETFTSLEKALAANDGLEPVQVVVGCTHGPPCEVGDLSAPCRLITKEEL
jgi:hypothetical protein